MQNVTDTTFLPLLLPSYSQADMVYLQKEQLYYFHLWILFASDIWLCKKIVTADDSPSRYCLFVCESRLQCDRHYRVLLQEVKGELAQRGGGKS